MRIIIAGGGTGGHIFPAIAVAHALKRIRPETSILFVGAKDRMEMEKVPQAGYPIEGLTIAGFNRSSLIKNLRLPYLLLRSFLQVRGIFRRFRPDAVLGVGGYASFPVLRTAQAKGIPSFLHESNSFAGKTNILLGKKATRIFTGTTGMERFFPSGKIQVTGNPVRAAIARSAVTREEGIRYFSLQPGMKTVLVVGGSLGARSVNAAVDTGLDKIRHAGLQLIWQTGKPYAEKARERCAGKPGVWVNDFISEMEYAYAAADLVVARAGAMTIAELSVVGKPVLFVPYPHAAEDHQTVNAEQLVREKAACLVKDSDVQEELVPALLRLSADESSQRELSQNIRKRAVTNADEVIAQSILKALGDA